MIFCSSCFKDREIQSIVARINRRGHCPVCGKKNVFLYDTDKDNSLQGMFDNLLSVYTPQEDLPDSYPIAETSLLGDALKNDWDIFSKISKESIINIEFISFVCLGNFIVFINYFFIFLFQFFNVLIP